MRFGHQEREVLCSRGRSWTNNSPPFARGSSYCCPLRQQLGHSEENVSNAYQPRNCQVRLADPLEWCLPKSPGRFHSTKDLLDPLSKPSAQSIIPQVAHRSPVNDRSSSSTLLGSGHTANDFLVSNHPEKTRCGHNP